ncbi:hypothetical protein [Streptomyces sp. NPDC051452]|uniref:hypothetical protein n=1 Tax=Streptomyces sp. NPDC051452 TaxID=3365654 RepID=UPI0037B12DB5
MIKKLAFAIVLAAALLAAAPAAEAAQGPGPSTGVPGPSAGVPGAPLLEGLLGSLEVGHPATSLQSIVPGGVLGG